MKKSSLIKPAVAILALSITTLVKASAVDAATIYRAYNPHTGEHHYTASKGEKDYIVSVGWHDEGIAWYTPDQGDTIYRLYNPHTGDHHYTTGKGERDHLIKVGWHDEGVMGVSSGSSPVYRLYNPNAKKAGSHHYTLSSHERDYLVKVGWRDEGIGWYAEKQPTSNQDTAPKTSQPSQPVHPPQTPAKSIPSSGTYRFTEAGIVRGKASLSSPELARYQAGQTVNYDSTLNAEGWLWVSYISASGNRRYIAVQKADDGNIVKTASLPNISSQSWELVLVNRNNKKAEMNPSLTYISGIPVDHRIANQTRAFLSAAQAIDSREHLISGYRSVAYQEQIYNGYVAQEMAARGISRAAAEKITQTYSQPAGASEHQTGLAIDMSTVNYLNQSDPTIVSRLKAIAPDYGFVLRFEANKQGVTGIGYEDWHWRYVGVESAKYMSAHQLSLEEYVQQLKAAGK